MPLLPGARLGPYEILTPLGAGGMGEVWRARDIRLDRDVAIKVLPERLAQDHVALARFEREAKFLATFSHPNLLGILDFGRDGDVVYAVTELLEGKTLRSRLRTTELSWREATKIGVAMAEGLAAAHARGIVHRDLKPENVFLTSEGRVKILDFGLARREAFSSSDIESVTPTLLQETLPGTVMGTVGYMAPEQVSGDPADARSDIFAFGCVLYEMVTGSRAFPGKNAAETIAAILRDEPADPIASGRSFPPDLNRVISHCLAREPARRFQSAQDLAFDLNAVLADSAVSVSLPAVRPRRPWRLWIGSAALIVLVALVGIILAARRSAPSARGSSVVPSIASLAVLPLENLSGDPDQAYFADGMTDELITELSQISGLRVVSRTSMMQYRGTRKPMPQIAKELNVDAVVEGSVARSGNRVTIQAHLIEAATDRSLWGARYERDLQDILTAQSEAVRAIATQIRVKLSPEEKDRLASARPVNARAYELYLRGRSAFESRTGTDTRTALRLFEQATALDPSDARAFAGIARVYLQGFSGVAPEIARRRAAQAAERALSVDESLPEAHIAAAGVRASALDWVGTEREYRRAIELDPNNVQARVGYGVWLSMLARLAEGLEQVRLAESLDPLSPYAAWAVATTLRNGHRHDESIAQTQKILALDPNYGPAHHNLGLCLSAKGKYEEAIAAFLRSGRAAGNIGQTYALAGRTREARKLLADLEAHGDAFSVAQIYVGLGDNDRAFEWLARENPHGTATFKVAEIWDPLRSDPRFGQLLERWRLSDAQTRPPTPGEPK
jgi:serine/threonine protein kinase/Tfp pilus assembly protein PilF